MKIPRINFGEFRQRLSARLRSKVRLPIIHKTVSMWAVIAVPVILAFAAGGVAVSNDALVCSNCHEMDRHYRSLQMTSHKDVSCEQCHAMPGYADMFKRKVGALEFVSVHVKGGASPSRIQGHVPDSSCKQCHKEAREMVVYHGLKITHKKHWEMGVKCTYCHVDLAHGEISGVKNTPKMKDCFSCHDGKKASNTCGLCHETLGVRRPTVFSPEWVEGHKLEVVNDGEQSCRRCHQAEFCDDCHKTSNPHQANWISTHPAEFARDNQSCKMCHTDAYCKECHEVKQAHEIGWINKHAAEFEKNQHSCNECHERKFCSDCHERYQPHPANYATNHKKDANKNLANCKTCHQDAFCVSCHKGTTPKSHTNATWLRTHGRDMAESNTDCSQCHNTNFCMECHKREKPASHKVNWNKNHPIQASMNSGLCSNCHTDSYCNKCHGMPMPHPKTFKSSHQKQAKSDPKLCQRCHEQQFCKSCHLGSRPNSHTKTWVKNHGDTARKSGNCTECHTTTFCDACHKSMMPPSHNSGWLKKHGEAGTKSTKSCMQCHDSKSCDNCHGGVKMPHAEDFMESHGSAKGASRDQGSVCYKCHDADYCGMCHE